MSKPWNRYLAIARRANRTHSDPQAAAKMLESLVRKDRALFQEIQAAVLLRGHCQTIDDIRTTDKVWRKTSTEKPVGMIRPGPAARSKGSGAFGKAVRDGFLSMWRMDDGRILADLTGPELQAFAEKHLSIAKGT